MRKHILLSIAILAGCGTSHDREQRAINNGDQRGRDVAAQARTEFSGATDQVAIAKAASIVMTLNTGEIAQANYILTMTKLDPSVRDLATEIRSDHQANNARLDALLQDRGITAADNPVSATLRNEAMTGLAVLQADPAAELQMDYAEMQVMMHQEGFVVVGALRDLVQDKPFGQFLSDTRDAIAKHREDARRVMRKLD
jgi:predicted outer membrane protein